MACTIVGCGVVRRVYIQNFKVFARKMKRRKPLPHHYDVCHFGYNLALSALYVCKRFLFGFIDVLKLIHL